MENIISIFWIVLGIGFIVAEIFTMGFVMFWFGIGAIAAGIVGFLGFGLPVQFIVFVSVSIILSLLSRPIFVKYLAHGDEHGVKMGVDSLPGQIGTVTTASKGALNQAAVKVFGSEWTAFPDDDSRPLVDGEKVEVVRVQGNSIWVRPAGATKEIPEWRETEKA